MKNKKSIEKVERALKLAFGKDQKTKISDDWQKRVMDRIRSEDKHADVLVFPDPEKAVWRFAWTMAAAAALLLAVGSYQYLQDSSFSWMWLESVPDLTSYIVNL